MSILPEQFWAKFKELSPLKHYHPSESGKRGIVSAIWTEDFKAFLRIVASEWHLTPLFSPTKSSNSVIKKDPNTALHEFLLDGILYQPSNEYPNIPKNIAVGIEWQWDWKKKEDLVYWDFPKLLHTKIGLGVLVFLASGSRTNIDESRRWALNEVVNIQKHISPDTSNHILAIIIVADRGKVGSIWAARAMAYTLNIEGFHELEGIAEMNIKMK